MITSFGQQSSTPLQNDYNTALDRWLQSQNQAQQQFRTAAEPLKQAASMFAVGGGYGAGQRSLLEQQAKQAKSEALLNQVNSGMSSGSLATSTGLRVNQDLSQGLLGVEDTRTQFLNQALQALSSLQAQQAGTTAASQDPFFNTYLGASTAQRGQNIDASNAARQFQLQGTAQKQDAANAQKQLNLQQQQLDLEKQKLAAASKSTGTSSSGSSGSTGSYKTLEF